MIQVDGVLKRFSRRRSAQPITAVDDVSFDVRPGQIVGLLGPNGAGKTTIIKMICGLLTPDHGRVLVGGVDVHRERLRALRHIAAVLEGNRNLYWRLTPRENLEYFAGNRGQSRATLRDGIATLLERFGLSGHADEPVSRLSRGMQQKLAITVAILADSEVVLLDEPTLGLDVASGQDVRALLRDIAATGRTLVVSTHDMSLVQDVCERVLIIDAGRVVVDDQVHRLLASAARRCCVVTLRRGLSREQHSCLVARFPLSRYAAGEHPVIEVCLDGDEDVYDLIDILRTDRTPIAGIDQRTDGMQRVFLDVVRGHGTGAPVDPRERVRALA